MSFSFADNLRKLFKIEKRYFGLRLRTREQFKYGGALYLSFEIQQPISIEKFSDNIQIHDS
jgi:hypothetical protein